MDDWMWKVMDVSSVKFHDKFLLHFLLKFSRKWRKNLSWKYMDESSVSWPSEFCLSAGFLWVLVNNLTYIGIIFCTIRGTPVQNLYSSIFTLVCCVHDSCPLHCMVDQDGCWRSIDPNLSSLFWLNMYVICICSR